MSFIQNFFTSRDNNTDGNTYVGQEGRLWYNPNTNSIYVNTANIAGGTPVALATGANITANNLTVNSITSTSGNISVTGNIVISGNISPAAVGKIGGIVPGPGANVSANGLLTIDTANLPLSFGNFTANNNLLTIVNVDENMILATQGNAEIQLVGNIGFYKSNGIPPDPNNQFFFARDDGQLRILVPIEDPLEGGVEIIGSATGNYVTPGATGTMLQLTGNPDIPCRVYHDSLREYSSYVARRYNGNTASPGQVLAGQDVFRINTTAATDAGMGNVAMCQVRFTALENQTTTAQGSEISFYVTPIGQPAANRVEVATFTAANGVTATQFNTAGNISATGNIFIGGRISSSGNIITSDNLLVQGLISAGANVIAGNLSLIGNGINSSSGVISTSGNIVATGQISASGNISTSTDLLVQGFISAGANVTAGNVNSYVTLPAGTTVKAPLTFTAGNVTSVPTAGSMNYDGKFFYATPQASERGLIVTQQIYILNTDYALTNQTAVQSMFGVSAAVSDNTRYAYVINAVIYKTANNITMGFALDGNAVLSNHTYQTSTTASATLATISTPSVLKNSITTGFSTPVTVTASLNGTGYYSLQVTGIVSVTTGGTWNPLIAFSGLPGAGSYVAGGSQVEIWPVGTANTTVSIGNWT